MRKYVLATHGKMAEGMLTTIEMLAGTQDAREVVHFQRFGEALRSVQEQLDAKNFYAFNPSFDCPCEASCKNS